MLKLSTLGKFSADDILKYFSYFSKAIGFNISCRFSTVSVPIFKEKEEKNIINFSAAELAQRVIKIIFCHWLLPVLLLWIHFNVYWLYIFDCADYVYIKIFFFIASATADGKTCNSRCYHFIFKFFEFLSYGLQTKITFCRKHSIFV